MKKLAAGGLWALAVLASAGCGGDDVQADPLMAAWVGDWNATSLVLTNVANPDVAPDLILDVGAMFTLNVQPSGRYTSILILAGQSQTEIGSLSLTESTVTFRPTTPPGLPASSALYTLQGNSLTLDGDSEFDFNLDGTPEPATAHFELVRQ